MNALAPLFALTMARLREFFREPGAVFWTFGFPLLLTVALGIAFRSEGVPKMSVAVVDRPGAATLLAGLQQEPALSVQVVTAEQATARLRTGEVLLVLEPAPDPGGALVYRFDASRPDATAVRRQVNELVQGVAGRADVLSTRDETEVARGGRYVDWLVPGLLGMQLLSGALWGTAWIIVNARQRKLLKRLTATPMSRRHYLLSFRLSGLLFVPAQVLVLFVFARFTFGVTLHGSATAVLALSLFASWSFAGLGLLCASRARNSETVNGLVNLVTLPMFMLSGVFFSSARFPAWLHPFIGLLPLTAYNDALRRIVNEGASLFSQGHSLAVLAVWGLLTSWVALRLFRWS